MTMIAFLHCIVGMIFKGTSIRDPGSGSERLAFVCDSRNSGNPSVSLFHHSFYGDLSANWKLIRIQKCKPSIANLETAWAEGGRACCDEKCVPTQRSIFLSVRHKGRKRTAVWNTKGEIKETKRGLRASIMQNPMCLRKEQQRAEYARRQAGGSPDPRNYRYNAWRSIKVSHAPGNIWATLSE